MFTSIFITGDTWGLISEVRVEAGSTIIIIRSIVQVYNHLMGPVDVYYMTKQVHFFTDIYSKF